MTATTHTFSYPFNQPEGLELDEAYAAAREAPGLIRVQLPYGEPAWLVTRFQDARLVLADRRFSRAMAVERDAPRLQPNKMTSGILAMDPPQHARLRSLVAKAFTLRRIEELRPRVRELVGDAVDGLVAAGSNADLVEDFALPITVAVICELLGVPMADWPRFRVWTDAAMSTSPQPQHEIEANLGELLGYLSGLIALRRTQPADDLMTALIEARDEHDRLSEEELVMFCCTLLIAGHETTATAIPGAAYVLLHRPELWARLGADPELIPAAVEELLRFVPLIESSGLPRYATEDVEVGGVLVRAGEPVLVALAAVNRDSRQFDAPDEVRFDRPENQHVGFGHGAHHCLGAQLARIELQEALRALLDRLPGLHLTGDPRWKKEMFVRGPRTMPVGW